MTALSEKITISKEYDVFAKNVVLGDLTERQYADLEDVVRLSPGYTFEVVRYAEHGRHTGGAATHVKVWKDGNDRDYVALVGRDCAQYYDGSNETEIVVRRIAGKVYRRTVCF